MSVPSALMAELIFCIVSFLKSNIFTSGVWMKYIFRPLTRLMTFGAPSVRYFKEDTLIPVSPSDINKAKSIMK